MNYLKELILSILAGICIGIGGAVYLGASNKIAGAVLFSVGLYAICTFDFNLFTGKVGYLATKNKEEIKSYSLFLLVVWIGNYIGTALTALLLSFTRLTTGLTILTTEMSNIKFQDSFASLLILGIFCGILMYSAVEGYKKTNNPLILIFCVSVFIISGFEHCIADMFYFSMALNFNLLALYTLLTITIGNSIGGMLIPLCKRLINK